MSNAFVHLLSIYKSQKKIIYFFLVFYTETKREKEKKEKSLLILLKSKIPLCIYLFVCCGANSATRIARI